MKVVVKCPNTIHKSKAIRLDWKCWHHQEIELRQEEVKSGDWSRACRRCGGRLTRKDDGLIGACMAPPKHEQEGRNE